MGTHEGKGDDIKYLTKWNQLPYSEATWESPKDIGDDEKIAQYHTRNKSIPQSKWKIKQDHLLQNGKNMMNHQLIKVDINLEIINLKVLIGLFFVGIIIEVVF